MENNYYSLPLKCDAVFDEMENGLKMCSEKESIDNFLKTLIMTCPGEHKYDRNFGCKIWDMDFVRMTDRYGWEKEFTDYLNESVSTYEHRITDVGITAHIFEESGEDRLYNSVKIKRKANVIIKSQIISTGERVTFYYTLYLGPISSK